MPLTPFRSPLPRLLQRRLNFAAGWRPQTNRQTLGAGRRLFVVPPQAPQEAEIVQHAVVSTFDLFSIGIGPSSSHTVGPMRAAKIFVEDLEKLDVLRNVSQLRVDLYGSLALTGVGHGTPSAILMGLEGEVPESVDTVSIKPRVAGMYTAHKLNLRGTRPIDFNPDKHLVFHFRETLSQHPNGMRFSAFDTSGDLAHLFLWVPPTYSNPLVKIATNEFFSIGGGFVVNEQTKLSRNVYFKDRRVDHASPADVGPLHPENVRLGISGTRAANVETAAQAAGLAAKVVRVESKFITAALPFTDAASLLKLCEKENLTIAQVVFRNELQ
ncbi:serine dehydratase beta chain-domain-containing protein, partial [Blyttiomyces helicus]